MSRRAQRIAIAVFLTFVPGATSAQVVWQPTPVPVVTAENTSWYLSGGPIEWNGDFYYPAGTPQFFNRYQMVRAGSYRGIPVYTDTTLEPYSIVFVPLAGQRMQPYERPRTGPLAGTSGSRVSNLPSDIGAEATLTSGIQQAAMPPTVVAAYDGALPPPEVVVVPRSTLGGGPAAQPAAVGTSGRSAASTGRTANRPVESVAPPTGLNGIWIGYDGQRWFANGKALEFSGEDFREVGSYHGWPVYKRTGDESTIYVPTLPGRVAPYKKR